MSVTAVSPPTGFHSVLLNRVVLDGTPDNDENHDNQRDCPNKPAVGVDDAEHRFSVSPFSIN